VLQENTETNGNRPYKCTKSERVALDAIAKELGPRLAERTVVRMKEIALSPVASTNSKPTG
jgi:hypothetical protein